VWTRLGVSEHILNPEDTTIRFYQNVLTEVMGLFPGRWIHVGGDEAVKTQWQASPRAQARIRALGLKDEHELQSWFIRRMDEFLTSRGRSLVGWDEILEGGLAPNAVVMSWRGTEGGIAAAQAGHDVVMTPGAYTYFDHYQSQDTVSEPLAIGGFLPLDSAYAYEPVPGALSPAEARHVLGEQGRVHGRPEAGRVHGVPEGVRARRGAVDAPGGEGLCGLSRAPGGPPAAARDSRRERTALTARAPPTP